MKSILTTLIWIPPARWFQVLDWHFKFHIKMSVPGYCNYLGQLTRQPSSFVEIINRKNFQSGRSNHNLSLVNIGARLYSKVISSSSHQFYSSYRGTIPWPSSIPNLMETWASLAISTIFESFTANLAASSRSLTGRIFIPEDAIRTFASSTMVP